MFLLTDLCLVLFSFPLHLGAAGIHPIWIGCSPFGIHFSLLVKYMFLILTTHSFLSINSVSPSFVSSFFYLPFQYNENGCF